MTQVIDTVTNVGPHAATLARAGVSCVMRYYNNKNVNHPEKRLESAEAAQLADSGISLAVVFQQRGGSGGYINDFKSAYALRDANKALKIAIGLGQTKGSAIYFAVDHDFIGKSELKVITAYFKTARKVLDGSFRIGCYGSGYILRHLLDAGLIDLAWLAQSTGWTGYKAFLKSHDWALLQGRSTHWPKANFGYDPNKVNPAFPDFGQFDYGSTTPAAPVITGMRGLFQVNARNGLNLRRGPGTNYDVVRNLPYGTVVEGLSRHAEWIQIDDEGDGIADGYMHSGYLELLAGELDGPEKVMHIDSPYGHARRELLRDIAEVKGKGSNPRIMAYHSSTNKGAPDSVAWCSSFTNWCVEKSGLAGTDSKWAMSWHDEKWGRDATDTPQSGDIVVYKRRYTRRDGTKGVGGHVGFFVGFDGDSKIALLGGNQGNRISIASFPRVKGDRGSQNYELLSIRRPLDTRNMSVVADEVMS